MSNNSLSFEFASGADSTQVQEQVVKSCSSSSSNLKEVVEVDEIDLSDFKYDYRTGDPALEDEQRAYEAYLDIRSDSDITVEDFREHYCGEWHSEEEFAENLVEDLGILDEVPEHLRRFFDMEAYARELFAYDYDYTDGFVFRVS